MLEEGEHRKVWKTEATRSILHINYIIITDIRYLYMITNRYVSDQEIQQTERSPSSRCV